LGGASPSLILGGGGESDSDGKGAVIYKEHVPVFTGEKTHCVQYGNPVTEDALAADCGREGKGCVYGRRGGVP